MYGHPDKSVVSVRHWICYYIWSIIFKGKKALLVYSLKNVYIVAVNMYSPSSSL